MTNQYSVHIELHVVGGDHDEAFDALLDAYSDLEQADEQLLDSAFSQTLNDDDTALIEVDTTVTGDSREDAWHVATCAIRSAIHATGGHTPSWDEALEQAANGGSAYIITERQEVVAVA